MQITPELTTTLNLIAEETIKAAKQLMRAHSGVLTPSECYRMAIVQSYIFLIIRLGDLPDAATDIVSDVKPS